MAEDGRLVHSLINGIVARVRSPYCNPRLPLISCPQLPDVTGLDVPVLYDDEVVNSARATLVEVSPHAIGAVLKRLISILDEFSKVGTVVICPFIAVCTLTPDPA